jgi:hypothetical protein
VSAALGGRLWWVHSGSSLYSRDARSLRYAAWPGSAIFKLKRRSAGILTPVLRWVCWAHQPLFPSAVFWGSSFNDGTTQTALDPLMLGAGSHHLKVSTSAQTKAVALSHRYSRD